MWYFAWILGTALAVSFGVLNALWFEFHAKEVTSSCLGNCGDNCSSKKA